MKSFNKGSLYILTTVVLWGSSFVGIKACLHTFSPGPLALARTLIASLAMLIIFIWQKKHLKQAKVTSIQFAKIAALSILGISCYNYLLNFSEQTLTSATVGFVGGQIPLASTIIATMFLKEQRNLIGWASIAISISGMLIIFFFNKDINLAKSINSTDAYFSITAMVFAIILASLYVSLQKPLLRTINPLSFTCYAIWFATCSLLYFLPQLIAEMHQASIGSLEAILYLGIFPSAIAYFTWSKGLEQMQASKAANLVYFMPLVTIALSWLVLSEEISAISLIGGFIAIVGALINNRYGQKIT